MPFHFCAIAEMSQHCPLGLICISVVKRVLEIVSSGLRVSVWTLPSLTADFRPLSLCCLVLPPGTKQMGVTEVKRIVHLKCGLL